MYWPGTTTEPVISRIRIAPFSSASSGPRSSSTTSPCVQKAGVALSSSLSSPRTASRDAPSASPSRSRPRLRAPRRAARPSAQIEHKGSSRRDRCQEGGAQLRTRAPAFAPAHRAVAGGRRRSSAPACRHSRGARARLGYSGRPLEGGEHVAVAFVREPVRSLGEPEPAHLVDLAIGRERAP